MLLTLSPFLFQTVTIGSFSWIYNAADIIANLILFIHVGFFWVLFLGPKYNIIKKLLSCMVVGLLLSVLIESLQLMLVARTAQYWDVICNTVSAVIGGIIGILVHHLITNFLMTHFVKVTLSDKNLCALFSAGQLLFIIFLLVMPNTNGTHILLGALTLSVGGLAMALLVSDERHLDLQHYYKFAVFIILSIVSVGLFFPSELTIFAFYLSLPAGLLFPVFAYFLNSESTADYLRKILNFMFTLLPFISLLFILYDVLLGYSFVAKPTDLDTFEHWSFSFLLLFVSWIYLLLGGYLTCVNVGLSLISIRTKVLTLCLSGLAGVGVYLFHSQWIFESQLIFLIVTILIPTTTILRIKTLTPSKINIR